MNSPTFALAGLSALALLAACGKSDDAGNGTAISIQGKTDKGQNASASADADGRVNINLPGFKADVNLPKIALDADNMDIGGVKLYPGSKVTAVNILGDGEAAGDQDKVTIVFDAPADAATLKTWFTEKMSAENFTLAASANGLSGKTDDGEPFTLDFGAGAAGHTTGTFTISG
ncbi:hypothetical protein [Sphingomonas cavernae]|uniref:Uncharacterized protein n=1 Tax=Sphingomonas cavernae TaxID=2320861 RepID=A0A418WKI2_9SPHN|nr:hypothetical protein [Sphingomonas cavernae]RJF90339.1 hypothetical protein D3876_08765 [Sphingomonas cavernae]